MESLPKVALIGDSIRMGYAPLVVEHLAGRAQVISPEPNGGDSANVLRHLEAWVVREQPDVVHLNCGLHDLKRSKASGDYQVPLAQYETNLRAIVDRLRQDTSASIVFATTTPILDERHAQRRADFDRFAADVQRYNTCATAVMQAADVPVHDLRWIVEQAGAAAVLAAYRRPATGVFRPPASAGDWQRQRPDVREKVILSLGDLPPRPAPPASGGSRWSTAAGTTWSERVYAALDADERFRSVLYPHTGHTYTPEMRAEMLTWFDRWLK